MNEPPGARLRVALTALAMTEYFRDEKNMDVLLFIDNIFRFSQAGSEVSALLGRTPSAVGYQPTLASEMGALQKRITSTKKGSITSFQAVYVPADDLSPVGLRPPCARDGQTTTKPTTSTQSSDSHTAWLEKVNPFSARRPRLSDLIVPGTRRVAPVVWAGLALAAFQQLVGIIIILYYGEVLWKAAGVTEQSALRINLLTGFVNIMATLLAIKLVDRVGRKPLLLAGSIGVALTLGAVTAVFATAGSGADGGPVLSRVAGVTGLIAANLYILAFGVSWGPVMWVLLGEMFPNRLRGAALSVSGATNWVTNFLVTVTLLVLLRTAGLAAAYAIYTAAAVLSVPFVWYAVRETKGKTLEQM